MNVDYIFSTSSKYWLTFNIQLLLIAGVVYFPVVVTNFHLLEKIKISLRYDVVGGGGGFINDIQIRLQSLHTNSVNIFDLGS